MDRGRLLEFLGRADNQVKIRGMRIELEEIEAQLADHPAVRQAVVNVHRHGGADQLVGYLVTNDDVSNDDVANNVALQREVAEWSRTRLPEYMVPTLFVALERVPLTANGKTDRRVLPAPDFTAHRSVKPPRTPRERLLCQAFADALNLNQIGIDEDFFSLGGDSIVAIRVVSRVRAQGYGLRPRDMFAQRTVESLAPLLVSSTTESRTEAVDPAGAAAATPILRWLDEVGQVGSVLDGFYQGMSLLTAADLSEDTLRAALGATVARHHLLWASAQGGADLVIPDSPPEVVLRVADSGQSLEQLREDVFSTLDPTAGNMIAFGWHRGDSGWGRLLVIAHHIVVDGVSLRILAEDIAASHRLIQAGRSAELPPVETPWRSWAQSLAAATADGAFDDDLAHWRQACATTEKPWGDRPLDPARDTVATEARLTVELDAATTHAVLVGLPERIHGHVNDAMVAALFLALLEWRAGRGEELDDAPALLIEMEGHGREGHQVGDIDLSATVGWFTTLYPVALRADAFDWRTALSDSAALGGAVRSIKDQLRAVPSHGLSYGALRYLRTQDDSLTARPQVLFNYLGRFDTGDQPWALAGDPVAILEDRDPAMPLPRLFEVNAEVVDTGDETVLRATFSWPSGAVSDADAARLAHRWRDLLTTIARSTDVRGHSASDFSRVALNSDDIAEFEARYPGLADVLP